MIRADARIRVVWSLLGAYVLLSIGCAVRVAQSPLPHYPMMSGEDSLRVIADRQAEIASVSARCEILLTDTNGQRVKLDGALLAMPLAPGGPRVRLRAWKLGRAVFDFTLADGRAWLEAAEHPLPINQDEYRHGALHDLPSHVSTPAQPARRFAETTAFFGPDFFRSATIISSSPGVLTAAGSASWYRGVICEIDRATLTSLAFISSGGEPDSMSQSECRMSEYQLIGMIPWAHRLRVRGFGGSIDVTMTEVELNGELPATTFTPPAGAKELP